MLELIITAASTLTSVGAVVYSIYKITKESKTSREAYKELTTVRGELVVYKNANNSLSSVNKSLSNRIQDLEKTIREQQRRYNELVKKTVSDLNSDDLADLIRNGMLTFSGKNKNSNSNGGQGSTS